MNMKSVIVHYQEIALKGTQSALVHREAGAQHPRGDVGPRRAAGAGADGPHRAGAAGRRRLADGPRSAVERFRRRQLRPRRAGRRSTSTPSRRRSSSDLETRRPAIVPRLGQARRQAVSLDLAGDRARGRRTDQGSARLARRSLAAGVDDPCRGADARGVLLFRPRSAAPAASRSAPAAASSACCRAASTRRSRRGG